MKLTMLEFSQKKTMILRIIFVSLRQYCLLWNVGRIQMYTFWHIFTSNFVSKNKCPCSRRLGHMIIFVHILKGFEERLNIVFFVMNIPK